MTSFWEVAAPTWLQGVGTVGAFFTGGIILLRELKRDREKVEQTERILPSAISAWTTWVETEAARKIELRIVVNNAATEPVYATFVELAADGLDASARTLNIGTLPPGTSQHRPPDNLRQSWIHAEGGWMLSNSTQDKPSRDPRESGTQIAITLTFRDPAGRKWKRSGDGTLSQC